MSIIGQTSASRSVLLAQAWQTSAMMQISEAKMDEANNDSEHSSATDTLRRSLSEVQRYRPARAALLKRMSTLRQQTLTNCGETCDEVGRLGGAEAEQSGKQTLKLPSELRFNLTVDSIEEDFEEETGRNVQQPDSSISSPMRYANEPVASAALVQSKNARSLIINDDGCELQPAASTSSWTQCAHAECDSVWQCEHQLSYATPNKSDKQRALRESSPGLINRALNAKSTSNNQEEEKLLLGRSAPEHPAIVATLSNANSSLLFIDSSFDSTTLDDRYRSQSLSVHQTNATDDPPTLSGQTQCLSTQQQLQQRSRKKTDAHSQSTSAALLGLASSIYVNRMARRSVAALPNNSSQAAQPVCRSNPRSVSQSGSTLSVNSRHSTSSQPASRSSLCAPMEVKMVDATVQVNLTSTEFNLTKFVNSGPSFDSSVTGSMLSVSGPHLQAGPSSGARHKTRAVTVTKDDKRHSSGKTTSDMIQLIGVDYLRYSGLQTFKQLQPVKELQRQPEPVQRPTISNSGNVPCGVRVPRSSSTPSLSDSANASSDEFKLVPTGRAMPLESRSREITLVTPAVIHHSSTAIDKCGCDTVEHTDNTVMIELCPPPEVAKKPESDAKAQESPPRSAAISRQPVARRLALRKEIFTQRRNVAKCTFAACLFGLLLMIVENEITLSVATSRGQLNHSDANKSAAIVAYKESTVSASIKMLITVSTVILEFFIAVHHVLEMRLFLIENGVPDWRLAITGKRLIQFFIEFIVCAVHPAPFVGNQVVSWPEIVLPTKPSDTAKVPFDVFLCVPMFFRAYLAFRVVVIHSRLLTDASSRSIGALNRISFNTRFVMKTFMTICPGTVLLVFITALWLGFSWILRLCDSYHSSEFENYGNAIWLIAVTFFSIGYGDIVPVTLCGRIISILTGITGAGSTAFVVAVVARKLELSRAEKHVHNFMLDTCLTKNLKNAAANVLRETWLIYKYTKLAKRVNSSKVRHHQRKFLQALQALRKVKLDQRKLNDNANQLVDIAKIHTQLAERMDETQEDQNAMLHRIESLEVKISALQKSLDSLPQVLVDKFIQRTVELARAAHNEGGVPQSANANTGEPAVAPSGTLLR